MGYYSDSMLSLYIYHHSFRHPLFMDSCASNSFHPSKGVGTSSHCIIFCFCARRNLYGKQTFSSVGGKEGHCAFWSLLQIPPDLNANCVLFRCATWGKGGVRQYHSIVLETHSGFSQVENNFRRFLGILTTSAFGQLFFFFIFMKGNKIKAT